MKKLIFLTLVIVSNSVMALPVGNPSEASLAECGSLFEEWCWPVNVRAGFYGDYVFDHHAEFVSGVGGMGMDNVEGIFFDRFRLNTNAGILALNFFERVDFFTTLGVTNIRASITSVSGTIKPEFRSDFSWSVGGRATIFEWCNTAIGVEGQYFRFDGLVERVINNSSETQNPDFDARYREWQVGLGVSQKIWNFVPYVAGRWNEFKVDVEAENLVLIRNRKRWGWAVGVSLLDCCFSFVTAEARFGNETALYVNGEVRF